MQEYKTIIKPFLRYGRIARWKVFRQITAIEMKFNRRKLGEKAK